MLIGSYQVKRVTAKTVTVAYHNPTATVARPFQFRWDGRGFRRQGKYLCTDGIHAIEGGR
jgi:hypothetical protein